MDALRQRQLALGAAQKIVGVLRRVRLHERVRIGKPDVLDRHAHHAAREVKRVLAAIDHAAEPVKRGVGVRAAHGFVQRADKVVMPIAVLVVKRRAALHERHKLSGVQRRRGLMHRGVHVFRQVEHRAPVAIGHARQGFARFRRKRQLAAGYGLRPLKQMLEVRLGQAA